MRDGERNGADRVGQHARNQEQQRQRAGIPGSVGEPAGTHDSSPWHLLHVRWADGIHSISILWLKHGREKSPSKSRHLLYTSYYRIASFCLLHKSRQLTKMMKPQQTLTHVKSGKGLWIPLQNTPIQHIILLRNFITNFPELYFRAQCWLEDSLVFKMPFSMFVLVSSRSLSRWG